MTDKLSYCSFCGRSEKDAMCLIAGPTVFICDGCVEISVGIVLRRARTVGKVIPLPEATKPPAATDG